MPCMQKPTPNEYNASLTHEHEGCERKWAVFPKDVKEITEENALEIGDLADLDKKYGMRDDVYLATLWVKKKEESK